MWNIPKIIGNHSLYVICCISAPTIFLASYNLSRTLISKGLLCVGSKLKENLRYHFKPGRSSRHPSVDLEVIIAEPVCCVLSARLYASKPTGVAHLLWHRLIMILKWSQFIEWPEINRPTQNSSFHTSV